MKKLVNLMPLPVHFPDAEYPPGDLKYTESWDKRLVLGNVPGYRRTTFNSELPSPEPGTYYIVPLHILLALQCWRTDLVALHNDRYSDGVIVADGVQIWN